MLKERSAMRVALRIECIFLLLALLATAAQCIEKSTEKANILASEDIKIVHVGDIEMAYRVMGQGEPLVMIMGSGLDMDWWPRKFLDNLSSKYQVIVFDNRGMGYTTASPANFSMAQFANDTAGLMDALGIKQANILGYSMGGMVAQELAIGHPEKVKRLILIATSCGGPEAVQTDPEIVEKIAGKTPDLSDPAAHSDFKTKYFAEIMYPQKWLAENPDFYNRTPWDKERSSPENVKRQDQAGYQWPGTYDRLYRIRAPTLIVAGMEDMLPPENSLILANRIYGSWLVRLENAGHGLVAQYPDRIARIATDFIELSP